MRSGTNIPFSQNVPVQPVLQVQAPPTWSHDAWFSHWQRCLQPGPNEPAGHSGTDTDHIKCMINTVTFITDIEVFMEYRGTVKSKIRTYMGQLSKINK